MGKKEETGGEEQGQRGEEIQVARKQMTEGRLSRLGGKLAARGPLWAGSVCWSSVWACLHADRWQGGRKRHTGRWDPLVFPRQGWNTQRGGEQWSVAESHRLCEGTMKETQPSQKESLSESERHRWAGREGERVTEKGWESCRFPPPLFPASSAVLAMLCSGEERLQKPSPRLHVWTQSLPLPC